MAAARAISVNIDVIKKYIELFDAGIQGKLAENFVLTIGSSRSGKTTLLNILAGKSIENVKIKGSWGLDVVNKDYAKGCLTGKGFSDMKIVHGSDSGTKFPNCFQFQGMTFIDCAGFGDTRTTEIEISNSVCINKILSGAATKGKVCFRLIVVQDYSSIYAHGGKSFKDSLKTICRIFDPIETFDFFNLIKASLFIFNKVPSDILSDPDLTPEFFLSNVIDHLITTVSTKDMETKSIDEQQCAKFVQCMRLLQEDYPTKPLHIEIPLAFWNSNDMTIFTGPVNNPTTGVASKLLSLSQLKDCNPKLTVSTEAAYIVFQIQETYNNELRSYSQDLKKLMTDKLEEVDKAEAIAIVEEISSYARVKKNELDKGGATRLTKKLIDYLDKLEFDEGILAKMKSTVKYIEYFDSILKNCRSGANFLVIYKALWEASSAYLTVKEREEYEVYANELESYMKLKNGIATFFEVLCASFSGVSRKKFGEFTNSCAEYLLSIINIEKPEKNTSENFSEVKNFLDSLER